MTFLKAMKLEDRRRVFANLLRCEIPALIIARNMEIFPELLEIARKHGRTLLRSELNTVELTSQIIDYLNRALAPQITRHGVLMNINGQGVLLLGESGIGMSDTASELLKRGHRLVADDAVEIRRVSDSLYGTAPELIRHYIEIRGIGVIAVQQLFGDTGTNIIGTRHGEKLFETLMTREERLRSEDMGGYYRVAADNRDLNYDKFVVKGEVHTMADDSYTSHNTHRLDVEGTVKKILTTDYVRNALKEMEAEKA